MQHKIALFIDEMETVSSPAVPALVAGLVGRLAPHAMVVVGSRNLPDIGLARLRANGQLLEIGPRLLRLSAAEPAEFIVSRRGLQLPSDQVERLHRRTEGWITALWLASMALEQGSGAARFIAGFTGSNANLADYFANVVLAAQPAPIRDFLLATNSRPHRAMPCGAAATARNCWHRKRMRTCSLPRATLAATLIAATACLPDS